MKTISKLGIFCSFFVTFFAKMRLFRNRQKFLDSKFFWWKIYILTNVFSYFRPKSARANPIFRPNFEENTHYQKNDLNSGGQIENRQKFLTKKNVRNFFSKKYSLNKKYNKYTLFSHISAVIGRVVTYAGLGTTLLWIFLTIYYKIICLP